MALTWQQQIDRGGLTVKGAKADIEQAMHMHRIVTTTRKRGGDFESQAGALATAVQESGVRNLRGGDRDSAGLFQQRASMGWGSYAQITNPDYAVNKFLDTFLGYRRRGEAWLIASHKTQKSAFASAPAKWFGEAQRATRWFLGAGANASPATGLGVSGSFTMSGSSETREQPYEFSRGSVDKKDENSVECAKRLADEVEWRFFSRRGVVWFCSEDWLIAQPPFYRLSALSQGVNSQEFEWEVRTRSPNEATLRVVAKRYALAPGDCVEFVDSGPGNGKWLVVSTRNKRGNPVVEVALRRVKRKLPEPAAEQRTTTNVTVGSSFAAVGGFGGDVSGAEPRAARAYQAAQAMSNRNIPYSQANRYLVDGMPGADCSSSTSWVLLKAGIPLPGNARAGTWAPVSGSYVNWGASGPGRYMTIYTNPEHIWIRWNGVGSAWRFDTSSYGSGGNGPKQRSTPRPTAGFVARHWPGT
jgi:hypothetical protein